MDVSSKRISLTAWGRLYGFNKATTSRLHRPGKLPPGLQIEQLPNGQYYVIVPPEGGARCVLYARVSSVDRCGGLDRQAGRLAEWATQHDCRPDEVVKEIGSGLNGNRRQLRRTIGDPLGGHDHSRRQGAALPVRLRVHRSRPVGPGLPASWWWTMGRSRTTWSGT